MSSIQNKFPAIDRDQWLMEVANAVSGGDPAILDRIDEDGLEINVLYDIGEPCSKSKIPCDITRIPVDPKTHMLYGWDICQPVNASGSARETNGLILDELRDGVKTIWLEQLPTANLDENLPMIMKDIELSAIGINLDAGNAAITQLAKFASFAKTQEKNLSNMRLFVNLDPFAPDAAFSLLDEGLDYAAKARSDDLPFQLFRANGWEWHNRGMTTVQELAYVMASLTEIMREGMARGLDLGHLASNLSASIALPTNLFDGIAKCRALRRCWGGIVGALGLDPDAYRLFLQGAVSVRMFSLIDVEMNMLRITTALLGGAIGGADQLSSHPHDCLEGGSAESRRLARMQHYLLIEESGLSQSLDPSGGAGFIEARSNQLADSAWQLFQKIEGDGGAKAVYLSGQFNSLALKAAAKRHSRFAAGDLNLIGVNLQPDGRSMSTSLPHWCKVRRPAAALEAIRQAAMYDPPRILILQGKSGPPSELMKLRTLLEVGGIKPVQMRADEIKEQEIVIARPDLVILLENCFKGIEDFIPNSLKDLQGKGKVIGAMELLHSSGPIDVLADIAGVDLEGFRKGDL